MYYTHALLVRMGSFVFLIDPRRMLVKVIDIGRFPETVSDCTLSIILDSETFHDNLFFTIVTAAIAEIQLNYKNYAYFEMS